MNSEGGCVVITFILASCIGMTIGSCNSRSHYQNEAISRGVAEYDSKTGQWKWSVEKQPEEAEKELTTNNGSK